MKFRLLATIITLAAVITATTPLNAQRRSSANSTNDEKVETSRSGNKNKNVSEKVATRNSQINREEKNNKSNSDKAIDNASKKSRRSTGYTTNDNKSNNNKKEVYNSNRVGTTNNSERYYHNPNDSKYKPNDNYRGSNEYWSSDFRTDKRPYNHTNKYSKRNNNFNTYNHWDRSWEGYRWNQNSWINYYEFYNPYSYRNNKYYYHHNYYGHVIRKFAFRPQIFIHNHTKYYCYDGHFFRYHNRVGYVLVDMPFGMAFEYLPNDYERVYINGFLYFRVDNLFFEPTNYGFQLVHYPERYYAYNDGYQSDGFRFND